MSLLRDLMSPDVQFVGPDMTIAEAARIMSERQVRRLPVVNRSKRLVGIVALGDFAVADTEIRPAAQALAGISKP